MRVGDVVKHGPSGETWVIAWVDQYDVMPAGWPETMARPSDCTLVKACSDDEHLKFMREVAAANAGTRSNRCREALAKLGEGRSNG